MVDQYKALVKAGIENLSRKEGKRVTGARIHEMLFEANPNLLPIGKQAVDYWLQAADNAHVDTPFAAMNVTHFEAFLKILGAGVMAPPGDRHQRPRLTRRQDMPPRCGAGTPR